jgi:hypothetical protein
MQFLLEHVATMNTVSIGTSDSYENGFYWKMWELYRLFSLEHVVTRKNASIGSYGNYEDCFYCNMW